MPLKGIGLVDGAIQLQGYPEAVKVLRLSGPTARQLADLALHKADLDLCIQCLSAINAIGENPPGARQGLWRSAIVHFLKCFGSSKGRICLRYDKVFQGKPETKESFDYFQALRNKHVVHDDNPYSPGFAGAILNADGSASKIGDVFGMSVVADALEQNNWANLRGLATNALEWVVTEVQRIAAIAQAELEAKGHAELMAMEGIDYTVPTAAQVHEPKPAV